MLSAVVKPKVSSTEKFTNKSAPEYNSTSSCIFSILEGILAICLLFNPTSMICSFDDNDFANCRKSDKPLRLSQTVATPRIINLSPILYFCFIFVLVG